MDKTNLEPRRLNWRMAVRVTIMNIISWIMGSVLRQLRRNGLVGEGLAVNWLTEEKDGLQVFPLR